MACELELVALVLFPVSLNIGSVDRNSGICPMDDDEFSAEWFRMLGMMKRTEGLGARYCI